MQMPYGNRIFGYVQSQYMNLNIYISSKIVTEGLCGSFDENQSNDLMHRFDGTPATLDPYSALDVDTAASWRSVTCTLLAMLILGLFVFRVLIVLIFCI